MAAPSSRPPLRPSRLPLAWLLPALCLPLVVASGAPPRDIPEEDLAATPPTSIESPVTITLVDGSTIRGSIAPVEIPFVSSLGTVSIPLARSERWTRIEGSTDRFAVDLRLEEGDSEGDRISGRPKEAALVARTLLGHLTVPFETIASIEVAATFIRVPRHGPILHFDLRGYSPSHHAGIVEDRSGLGNDGRFIGADPRPAGVFARSCIEVPFDAKSPLYPTDEPFSVEVQFRTTASDLEEAEAGEMMLWSTHYAGTGTDGAWLMVDTAAHGGRVRAFVGPGHTEVVGETVVVDGAWHTALLTFDGRTMRLVVDGELEGSARSDGPRVYAHRAPMRIGHTHASGAVHAQREKYYFRGEFGDVRIFERALGASEWRASGTRTPEQAPGR